MCTPPAGHDGGWLHICRLLSARHDRAGGGEATHPSARLCRWFPTMAETVSLAFHSPDSRSQVTARSLTAGLLSAPRVHIFCPRLPELRIHNLEHWPQWVLPGPDAQDSPLGVLPSWGSCQQDFVSWLGLGLRRTPALPEPWCCSTRGPANRSRHPVGALLWPRVRGSVQSLSHGRGRGPYQAGVPQVPCKFKGDSSRFVPLGLFQSAAEGQPSGPGPDTAGNRGAQGCYPTVGAELWAFRRAWSPP